MNNDIVIVIDDPVEWAIFARMNGEEPDITGRTDAVPFFKKRPNANSHFSENERHALEDLDVPSETLVVKLKQLSQNGEWHLVYKPLSEGVFKEELFKLGDASCLFLKNLGVKNLEISVVDEVAEKCRESGQQVSKRTLRKITGENSRNRFIYEAQARFAFLGTFEKRDSDYRFCSSCLKGSEVLSSKFDLLLEQLKENRLVDHYSAMARFQLPPEFIEKCHSATAVADKFDLIDSKTKGGLEREEGQWIFRSLTLKYSFDLS